MSSTVSPTEDDRKKIEEEKERNKVLNRMAFVKSFKLPNSQFHFKMEKIKSWTPDGGVLLRGREGSTNQIMNLKVTDAMFRNILDNNPKETQFLLDDYYSHPEQDHSRDTCNPIDRSLE